MPGSFAPSPQGSLPYQSFDKFEHVLDYYHTQVERGNPVRLIDRATLGELFDKDYEAYALVSALRRLGAITLDGTPTETFWSLADPERRKVTLASVIRRVYPRIVEVAARPDVTRNQVEEALTREYKIHGSTRSKAAAFFIAASDYAGVPIAAHLAHGSVLGRTRRAGSLASEPPGLAGSVSTSENQRGVSATTRQEEPMMLPASVPSTEGANQVATRVLYHVQGLAPILPTNGKWTKARRDRWVQAVTAVLDAHIEVENPAEESSMTEKPAGAQAAANGFARPQVSSGWAGAVDGKGVR